MIFNQEAFWAATFVMLVGLALVSAFASHRRLKEWAEAEGLKILKTASIGMDAPDEIAHGSRKRAGAYYVTVEDQAKNVFSAWIDVGGIFAVFTAKAPKVVWDNRPGYLRR